MQRRHGGYGGARCRDVLAPVAAQPQNAFGRVEQRLGRGAAQTYQDLRIYQFDLALDEGTADFGFMRRRRAVARRSPWNDIGYVGAASVEPDGGQHPVQQLPRAADERQPLQVL